MLSSKVGRNDPCPCGSGKKYKRCHGWNHGSNPMMSNYLTTLKTRIQADRIQRERQQGRGKPIISAEINGHRLVVVKNRLLQSRGWLTFHDFLLDYIKIALGIEWGKTDLAKPIEERHPILVWYEKVGQHKRSFFKEISISTHRIGTAIRFSSIRCERT